MDSLDSALEVRTEPRKGSPSNSKRRWQALTHVTDQLQWDLDSLGHTDSGCNECIEYKLFLTRMKVSQQLNRNICIAWSQKDCWPYHIITCRGCSMTWSLYFPPYRIRLGGGVRCRVLWCSICLTFSVYPEFGPSDCWQIHVKTTYRIPMKILPDYH